MTDSKLKEHYSLDHMRTLDRASERVSSWPQWKRKTFRYKGTESSKSKEMECTKETTNQQK
jgi:hypothetical protein